MSFIDALRQVFTTYLIILLFYISRLFSSKQNPPVHFLNR